MSYLPSTVAEKVAVQSITDWKNVGEVERAVSVLRTYVAAQVQPLTARCVKAEGQAQVAQAEALALKAESEVLGSDQREG